MRRRGFTLMELTISIALLFLVMNTAFAMLGTAFSMNQSMIADKELMEVGEMLETALQTEFSRAASIDGVLDTQGNIHSSVGNSPIEVQCIKLLKSKQTHVQSSYFEELIYLKNQDTNGRKGIWVTKNSNKYRVMNIKHYKSYGGFEVGTQVDSFRILKEEDLYRIELSLRYKNTENKHNKSFLVKLQD